MSSAFSGRSLFPSSTPLRRAAPLFITVSDASRAHLDEKMERLRKEGYFQIGAVVSSHGVSEIQGPAEYVCMMSRFSGPEATGHQTR